MVEDKDITASIDFRTGNLKNHIINRLGILYPKMSLEKRIDVAGNVVNQVVVEIQKYRNSVLYDALVLYGMQKAKDFCKEFYDE